MAVRVVEMFSCSIIGLEEAFLRKSAVERLEKLEELVETDIF